MLVIELCDADRIAMLWVRVPTGTTERYRERPVPSLQKKGVKLPAPLRNKADLRSALVKENVSDDSSLPAAVQRHAPATDRLVLGLQPNKTPGLLPEFGYFVHVVQPVAAPEPHAPSSGRFLSRHLSTWGRCRPRSVWQMWDCSA